MKKNKLVEYLYDIAGTEGDNGELSKLDEQKLKKALDNNKKLMARNKDIFSKEEPKFHTCQMYNPCPLCDKCLNKASHLYVKCQSCNIPICVHTHKDREKMIKRKNFRLPVDKNVYEHLLRIEKEYAKKNM